LNNTPPPLEGDRTTVSLTFRTIEKNIYIFFLFLGVLKNKTKAATNQLFILPFFFFLVYVFGPARKLNRKPGIASGASGAGGILYLNLLD